MKKKLAILLAMVMTCSLAACGSGKNAPVQKPVESNVNETQESKENESVIPESKEEQAVLPETEPVAASGDNMSVMLEKHTYSQLVPNGYTLMAQMEFSVPVLSKEDAAKYPLLDKALKNDNATYLEICEDTFNSLVSTYQEGEDWYKDSDMYLYDRSSEFIVRADSQVFSIMHLADNYWGGAHGMYGTSAECYDSQTGKRLALLDVINDVDEFFRLVDEKLQQEYSENYEYMVPLDEYREGANFSDPVSNCWLIDNEGVTYYFGPYVLGPYAMGDQVVTIYFDEAPELFNKKYVAKNDTYVIPFNYSYVPMVDVDKDGTRESVGIWQEYDGEDAYLGWEVIVGEKELYFDDWCYSTEAYLVHANDTYYCYVFEASENDWTLLRVVDLKTMKEVHEGGINVFCSNYDYFYEDPEEGDGKSTIIYTQTVLQNPNAMDFGFTVDVLGTYGVRATYHIGKDGFPETDDAMYESTSARILKSVTDVTCTLVDAQGNEQGETVIPANTYLFVVRCDGLYTADLQVVPEGCNVIEDVYEWFTNLYTMDTLYADENKPFYRVTVDKNDYPYQINGMPEDEVFAGIMYAG